MKQILLYYKAERMLFSNSTHIP